MDGADLQLLGLTVGVIGHGWTTPSAAGLCATSPTAPTTNTARLSARQQEVRLGGHGPARATLAIVDEVDSILIDEARTPLIISGPLDDRSDSTTHRPFFPQLDKTDYDVDEKQRTVTLTKAGMEKIETCCRAGQLKGDSLYDVENVSVVHHTTRRCARTRCSARQGHIVRDDEVIIIDDSPAA